MDRSGCRTRLASPRGSRRPNALPTVRWMGAMLLIGFAALQIGTAFPHALRDGLWSGIRLGLRWQEPEGRSGEAIRPADR